MKLLEFLVPEAIISLAPKLNDECFRDRLRSCRTRQEVVDLIAETDQEASQGTIP